MSHSIDTLPREVDVVVVGGGLAGLAVSALVAQEGRSVVLLEQKAAVGGRAATQVQHEVHWNLGPHALYCGGHAFRLLQRLEVPFKGRFPKTGRGLIIDGDTLATLPTGLGSLLACPYLSLREKWRFSQLLTRLPRLDPRQFDSVPLRDWIAEVAGPGNLATLLRTLFRVSTYADDPDRMSAGAAIEQLKLGLAGSVWYLNGGWQTLADGLRNVAVQAGAEVRTGVWVKTVRSVDEGVSVDWVGGETVRARKAVLAVSPGTVCELLGMPAGSPFARHVDNLIPVRAACLDLALDGLPKPDHRFALGLDRPLYYSVHSATAQLAPEGTAVIHALKYLGRDTSANDVVERELEALMDRLQPGWHERTIQRRFLPGMVVAHHLPSADEGGLTGRPAVRVTDRPDVFLAGDWVGARGMLADASAASAEEASQAVLSALAQSERSVAHVTR